MNKIKILDGAQNGARTGKRAHRRLAQSTLNFRVTEKGGVGVYGLNRYPVTLYADQWIRLMRHSDELLQVVLDCLREQPSPGN